MPEQKLVLIEWRDAVQESDWQHGQEREHEDDVCHTVGYIVGECDRSIRLAQTLGMGQRLQGLQIPRGMIKRVIPLAEVAEQLIPNQLTPDANAHLAANLIGAYTLADLK